jgi:hypothetical protein
MITLQKRHVFVPDLLPGLVLDTTCMITIEATREAGDEDTLVKSMPDPRY